jgi:hypothetical protein
VLARRLGVFAKLTLQNNKGLNSESLAGVPQNPRGCEWVEAAALNGSGTDPAARPLLGFKSKRRSTKGIVTKPKV